MYFRTKVLSYESITFEGTFEGTIVCSSTKKLHTEVLPEVLSRALPYFRKYTSAFYLSSKIFSYSATYGTRLHDYTCTHCTCTVHALCARVCSCVRVRVRVEL
jgi:hypothetical protein